MLENDYAGLVRDFPLDPELCEKYSFPALGHIWDHRERETESGLV